MRFAFAFPGTVSLDPERSNPQGCPLSLKNMASVMTR